MKRERLLHCCSGFTEPIFDTGKIIILDSGFCVLESVISLKRRGYLRQRWYWPKYVDINTIKQCFKNVSVGVTRRLPGELRGEKFDLFCLKEPDYVMILMSTYGSLNANTNQRDSIRYDKNNQPVVFKYNNVVGNHFEYQDSVDQHIAKRHDCGIKLGLSLEGTWKTTRWPIRVFFIYFSYH